MKKTLISLFIYTIVIFGIAYYYHEHYFFEIGYSLLIGLILMYIANTLMPGSTLNSGKPINQLQYRNLESIRNESKFGNFEWYDILIPIYLIIPVALSLYIYLLR